MARWVNGKVVDGQGGYSVSSQRTVALLGLRWLGRLRGRGQLCIYGQGDPLRTRHGHCARITIVAPPSPSAPLPRGEMGGGS
jgi:hypothetical protein